MIRCCRKCDILLADWDSRCRCSLKTGDIVGSALHILDHRPLAQCVQAWTLENRLLRMPLSQSCITTSFRAQVGYCALYGLAKQRRYLMQFQLAAQW